MIHPSHSSTFEVVQCADGRYSVREVGSTSVDDDAPVFDTEMEAENWLFDRNLRLDADLNDLHVIKPGGGQGLP
jgi:hypothetical protein